MQTAFAFADENDWPDIALLKLVSSNGIEARMDNFLGRKRYFQPEDVSGVEQTVDMFRQSKDGGTAILAGVTADAFEHPDAVMKCMGQDMNVGFPPRNQFTVHPNLTVFHRSPPSPEHSANQNP